MKQNKNTEKEFTGMEGALQRQMKNSAGGILGGEWKWGMRKGKTS